MARTGKVVGSATSAMAAVHAVLIIRAKPMTTDEIMDVLQISRGSAHTQLQELVEWRLVHAVRTMGSRQVRFITEKDSWQMMLALIRARKSRELEPILELRQWLDGMPETALEGMPVEAVKTLKEIAHRAESIDSLLNRFLRKDERWWNNWLQKGLRRN